MDNIFKNKKVSITGGVGFIANNIGLGDEVITTSVTAFPTITGVMQAEATPVVIDISADDGLLDCTKISEKTRAIILMHLYRQSCNMDAILEIAKSCNLVVIEDCAQVAGATYNNKKCGAMGVCGDFSFYPTKNLGAYGDTGVITTDNKELYNRLFSLRNYGQTKRCQHDFNGINSRLDELQGAILRVKLQYLDMWNEKTSSYSIML